MQRAAERGNDRTGFHDACACGRSAGIGDLKPYHECYWPSVPYIASRKAVRRSPQSLVLPRTRA